MRPSSRAVYARLLVLKCVVLHGVATPPPELFGQFRDTWPAPELKKLDEELARHMEELIAGMRKIGIWSHASPSERAFLCSWGSRMDPYAQKLSGWRMECAAMLMWALNLLPEPPIDVESNVKHLEDLEMKKIGWLSSTPSLKPIAELQSRRDWIEFWHWRVRTQRLIDEGRPLETTDEMRKAGLNSFDDIVRMSAKTAHDRGDLPRIMDEDFVFLAKPFRSLSREEFQLATSIIMERHLALNWVCGMAPGNRWDETPTDT